MSENSKENTPKIDKMNQKMQSDGDGYNLDPRVKEELDNVDTEEQIIGMYSSQGGQEERIPLIEKFGPGVDEWGGKSFFQPGQPRAVTLADNLAEAFPVLTPQKELIDNVVSDYEMRLTSLDGLSRDQLMKIFMSMFGNSPGENGETPGSIELALSAGPDNDD